MTNTTTGDSSYKWFILVVMPVVYERVLSAYTAI